MNPLVVIKVGGNIIDNPDFLNRFLTDFATLSVPKILIHGGGKIATQIGNKMGLEPQYINGRRITNSETIDLVTMVYGGLINKKMVASLQQLNCNAIGLTGADANLILAKKRPPEPIDFGFVGDIIDNRIQTTFLNSLLHQNISPVIAPLTHDKKGLILNTNADSVASQIAISMSQEWKVKLIYCFEKKGVLTNIDDDNSVISKINFQEYQKLLLEKKLLDGILPKIESAFLALNKGVQEIIIGDAKDIQHNSLQPSPLGTLLTLN